MNFSEQQLIVFIRNGIVPFELLANENQFNAFVRSDYLTYQDAVEIRNSLERDYPLISSHLFVSSDKLRPLVLFDGVLNLREMLVLPYRDKHVFDFNLENYYRDIQKGIRFEQPEKYELMLLANSVLLFGYDRDKRTKLVNFYEKMSHKKNYDGWTFKKLLRWTDTHKSDDLERLKDMIKTNQIKSNRVGDVITVYKKDDPNQNIQDEMTESDGVEKNMSVWKLSYLSAVGVEGFNDFGGRDIIRAEINVNKIYLYSFIRNEVILDEGSIRKRKRIRRKLLKH